MKNLALVALVAVALVLFWFQATTRGTGDGVHGSSRSDDHIQQTRADRGVVAGPESALTSAAIRESIAVPATATEPLEAQEPRRLLESEEWELRYSAHTAGQLFDERRKIERDIKAQSDIYFEFAWANGFFDSEPVTRTERGIRVSGGSEMAIDRIVIRNDIGILERATVPEDQYPEMYKLKRLQMWLFDRERQMKSVPLR